MDVSTQEYMDTKNSNNRILNKRVGKNGGGGEGDLGEVKERSEWDGVNIVKTYSCMKFSKYQ